MTGLTPGSLIWTRSNDDQVEIHCCNVVLDGFPEIVDVFKPCAFFEKHICCNSIQMIDSLLPETRVFINGIYIPVVDVFKGYADKPVDGIIRVRSNRLFTNSILENDSKIHLTRVIGFREEIVTDRTMKRIKLENGNCITVSDGTKLITRRNDLSEFQWVENFRRASHVIVPDILLCPAMDLKELQRIIKLRELIIVFAENSVSCHEGLVFCDANGLLNEEEFADFLMRTFGYDLSCEFPFFVNFLLPQDQIIFLRRFFDLHVDILCSNQSLAVEAPHETYLFHLHSLLLKFGISMDVYSGVGHIGSLRNLSAVRNYIGFANPIKQRELDNLIASVNDSRAGPSNMSQIIEVTETKYTGPLYSLLIQDGDNFIAEGFFIASSEHGKS